MKWFYVFLALLFISLTFGVSSVSATPGQCCWSSEDCSGYPDETCTGNNSNCPSDTMCVSQSGNCLDDGTLCNQGVNPDPCCNGCQNTGDPAPYDYTCGGIRSPQYSPSPPNPRGSTFPIISNPLDAGDCTNFTIDTAIGCIPIEPNALTAFILRWAIGIGGGIAFLLILYAGFIIMTSSGNPERLKAGQELLTSAIMGLILLIFSVFILRIIGIDILQIPGLGT